MLIIKLFGLVLLLTSIFFIIPILPVQAPNNPLLTKLVIIERNSLIAVSPPYNLPYFAVLSTYIGKDDPNYLPELIKDKYPELYRIITCESNWRDICNQKYGCKAGMGQAQFIPGTWKFIQDKGLKVVDPFNKEENLLAAIYLYKKYGNQPWLQSRHCWEKLNSN